MSAGRGPALGRWGRERDTSPARRRLARVQSTGEPEATVESPEAARSAHAPALQDGELVLLALRPSRWLLMVNLLGSLAIVSGALLVAVHVFAGGAGGAGGGGGWRGWGGAGGGPTAGALSLALGLAMIAWLPVAAWFMLDWRSHRYILTNRRVLAIVGMARPFVGEAPLAAVRRVELVRLWGRALRIGSVRFLNPHGVELVRWGLVSRPVRVRRTVLEALHKYGRGDVED